ncbi:uncharacterized protein LOC121425602 isoform X1 [Lytechinus variegatus]|uniref:uncharacterized protein LOC121425602 isoform X1 n=2 Tax=Lytechinus variegatus TaxID=7654 RepID=UPI001BB10C33|nr:uncharacterized protein LOC121425602 isoform X1 [Lytechinus variegatus]XP_041477652.1 uncharacterized protein LOC121425602 isoform X1 [Lytechinus variegatus]
MMATNDVITMLSSEPTKEAEFNYFTSDIKDVQNNKVKRRCYFRALSREKSLVLHSAKAGDECMRYRPRQITRIVEPEKKFLCVEYGPDDGPMYMLLDFNDSSESMDEWEIALYQLMGLENKIRERTKSESLRRRPSANKTKRAVSTFQPTNPTITTIPEKLGEQNNQDDTDIEPQFNATTTDGESSSQEHETRDRVDSDVDNVSLTGSDVMSPYSSLKSEGDDEHYRKEYQLRLLEEERDKEFVDVDVCVDELQRLTLSDYGEQVYVGHVEDDAPSNIHIGDRLLKMDNKNINTAQDAMNGIRGIKGEKTRVPVLLERFPKGNVCVVGSDVKSLNELGIVVKGSEITSTQGKFRRSCDPAWVSFKGERSTRSITAINDHPVSLQANTQQVTDMIQEALYDDFNVVFHVHPTDFLKELASSSSTNL